jgi:hypothetical protein
MSDARSGLGRIKDRAVGRRGHTSKHSKDEGDGGYFSPTNATSALALSAITPASPSVSRAFTWKNTPEDYQNGILKGKEMPKSSNTTIFQGSESTLDVTSPTIEEPPRENGAESKWLEQVKDIRQSIVINDPSIAGSIYGDGDLDGPLLEAVREPNNFQILLHRRHSISGASPTTEHKRNDAWWPRQMSFTDAEDAILGWEPIGAVSDDGSENDTWAALQNQNYIADDVRHLYEKIIELQEEIAPWASKKVDDVDALDELALHDIEAFQTLYYQQTESYQAVKQNSQDILGDERSHVMEAIKDVEVLGAKLEYEINALVSKVQDVEDGTAQFERMVEELESRADELEIQLSTESWIHWLVRSMTGIGTGPNITARGRAIQARRVQ